ncbi:M28 family peptidase [Bernardetia sp.]|uniref:M28 family peptidase n=1 Tax=Bernardetia sp. TaxID=1937974 RepID=UPI0025BA521D|nr:M28 family peptidase [Bernardetia sp.]
MNFIQNIFSKNHHLNLLEIVQKLENKSDTERFKFIIDFLEENEIGYEIQYYKTGSNIIVKTNQESRDKPFIGISSHFDVYPNSAGANDNGTAIAVCLDILIRIKYEQEKNANFLGELPFQIRVFFFDEEENKLKGSRAYVQEFGRWEIKRGEMLGLINLEMLGQGDRLALWNLEESEKTGIVLETLEKTAKRNGIFTKRFDQIVTNSADHVSFKNAKLQDAFTITSLSDKDIEISKNYYKAQDEGASIMTLMDIIQKAPIFEHYHKPTDLSKFLNEKSMQRVSSLIWQTLMNINL